jgi:hypothetical protein
MDEVEKFSQEREERFKERRDSCPKMLKDLILHRKLVNKEHQLLIIGTTTKPWGCNLVKLKSFFTKRLCVLHPNYSTRRELWEHFI